MANDNASNSDLIGNNRNLVRHIATDICQRYRLSVELEELEAAGLEGLVQAQQGFSRDRGIAFSTFAYYRIRGAILDNCRELGLIRRQYGKKAAFESAANEVLSTAAYSKPQVENLSAESAWIGDAFDGLATAFMVTEGGLEWVKSPTPNPEQKTERAELTRRLSQCLKQLTDEERSVIERFYFQNHRMLAIAKDFGVSKSWVSRVHTRALRKLKPLILAQAENRPP